MIFTVGQLTDQLKDVVESSFPSVWVSGEISNLSRPQSGHCYFTLKDEEAQLRGVMWRVAASRLAFELEDGLHVVCQGALEVYAPRGTYQLVVREMQPQGIGALELALRKLRERLAAEGLFAPERKRPLPPFPRRIAIVTSPTGAAIRDFLEVVRRRWSGMHVLVVPVRVQGEGAGREIAAAIAQVNQLDPPVDCLVVARGGGSLEDLWAFNEEVVVRAIHGSRVPVVSGVGHEIDITLADLVADVRALTPSEAAERVVPAADALQAALGVVRQRLAVALRRRVSVVRSRLEQLAGRRVFRRPLELVHPRAQRLDDLGTAASRAISRRLNEARRRIEALAAHVESLSPLGVLARGYSLTERTSDHALVRDAGQLEPGDLVTTRFARGQAVSRVERVDAELSGEGSGPGRDPRAGEDDTLHSER
jgi:exodeoxyribonuclease VII large subunit